ncbi:SWI/SNF complex subunit SWI3C isoform X1 [Macadamia integrifolia]|uniref:SWI/SNF complex subunit SWI3C isoform X1 n=1 Tax=Macadamia integrifolia TaxID=60698 RepID=UPI001C4FAE1C|nr:SWI/SNF complex subunit SWI3C isoform X1 [Macadamia integrifolia]
MSGTVSFATANLVQESEAEARGKWKKRKRDINLGSNSKRQRADEDDEEEEDDDEADIDDEEETPTIAGAAPNEPIRDTRESEVLSDGGGGRISDFPHVIKRIVNQPHSSVLSVVFAERAVQFPEQRSLQNQNPFFFENISHGQLQALSAVPADSPSLAPSDHDRDRPDTPPPAYVCTPPAIMEGRGGVKRFGNNRVLVVPMHADWFSPNSVHRLERQVVPHFFSGKSAEHTPEKYMDCRNRIVAKYMENPEKRLKINDCQGLAPGIDVNDLNRIFRFLDHWGIINYSVATITREPRIGGPYLREDLNGEIQVPSAALRSIDSLIQFDRPKSRLRPADVSSTSSGPGDESSDFDSRIRERLAENHCSYCSCPLSRLHYQSQKEADVLLCSDCFHDGRYVTGHSSVDFIRVDSTRDLCDLDGDSWTDQETLLLLEALEIYNDNWNEIVEHVGTKSKAQCILHFIRLPMEDGLLENIEVPNKSISSNMSSRGDDRGPPYSNSNGDSAGVDSENRIPFEKSANPLMALVSFLASAVGPRVAAACAHASLAALSQEEHQSVASSNIVQMEGSVHGDRISSDTAHGREGSSHGGLTNSGNQKEEIVQGLRGQNDTVSAQLSIEGVKNAAKSGLAAAATKAKLFAEHEEREIQRMAATIINHQVCL